MVSKTGSPIWYRDYEQNMVWQRALFDLGLQLPEKDSNKNAKLYAVSYGFLKKVVIFVPDKESDRSDFNSLLKILQN